MAGALSQSESDVVYRRLINVATSMRDISEEIERLKAENTTFDFSANLENPSVSDGMTKAEALAFVGGPMFDYLDFFSNKLVASDGAADSSVRRDKLNPLLLAEPLY